MSTKLDTNLSDDSSLKDARLMTTIRQAVLINATPAHIWDVLRDVGAVHQRLLPGRVIATRLEGDSRLLTFPDGRVIRELIVTIDDSTRRLAYAVVEGARTEYHHASFKVHPDGCHAGRLIWTTDVLPDTLVAGIRVRMERAAAEMKQAMETTAPPF